MTPDESQEGSAAERISVMLIGAQWGLRAAKRRLMRPGAAIIAAALLAAGVAQILKTEAIPSEADWTGKTPLNIVYLIAAIVALAGGFLVAVGYASLLRRVTENDELTDLCKALWAITLRNTSVAFDHLAVHVWAVRGIKGARYLEKRATFVPEARRTTPITWRKGKGAIGLCWARNHSLVADVEQLERQASDRSSFYSLPRDERFGFSWEELEESRHYRAILAIPLRVPKRGRYHVRGVLSIDLRVDGKANELDTLSTRDDFSAVLSVCEAVLRGKRG